MTNLTIKCKTRVPWLVLVFIDSGKNRLGKIGIKQRPWGCDKHRQKVQVICRHRGKIIMINRMLPRKIYKRLKILEKIFTESPLRIKIFCRTLFCLNLPWNSWGTKIVVTERPGARFSKAPETFRARKAIAKSRTLRVQSCLFTYSKDEGRFPSYKKFRAYILLRF